MTHFARPRRLWWGVAGLSLCASVLGFVTGRDVASLSETEAVRAYAAVYARETGGAVTDCLGMPGVGDVWLIVRCGTGARVMVFHVGATGGLVAGPTDVEA